MKIKKLKIRELAYCSVSKEFQFTEVPVFEGFYCIGLIMFGAVYCGDIVIVQ